MRLVPLSYRVPLPQLRSFKLQASTFEGGERTFNVDAFQRRRHDIRSRHSCLRIYGGQWRAKVPGTWLMQQVCLYVVPCYPNVSIFHSVSVLYSSLCVTNPYRAPSAAASAYEPLSQSLLHSSRALHELQLGCGSLAADEHLILQAASYPVVQDGVCSERWTSRYWGSQRSCRYPLAPSFSSCPRTFVSVIVLARPDELRTSFASASRTVPLCD